MIKIHDDGVIYTDKDGYANIKVSMIDYPDSWVWIRIKEVPQFIKVLQSCYDRFSTKSQGSKEE